MSDTTRPTVAIVDYGMGNLYSVQQACRIVGLSASITSSPEEVVAARAVILPGVGAYPDAIATLERLGLASAVREVAASGRPLVGICLGMQLMMSESEEFGRHAGLGIVPGRVLKLPTEERGVRVKVPQIGWTAVHRPTRGVSGGDPWRETLLDGTPDGEPMYFVHSYFVAPERDDAAIAISRYGDVEFCSALAVGNVVGCQFHPERSGRAGLHLYQNLARLIAPSGQGETQ